MRFRPEGAAHSSAAPSGRSQIVLWGGPDPGRPPWAIFERPFGAKSPLLPVHRLRIKHPLGDDLQFAAVELAEEARRIALVAGRPADLLDLQQHGVRIAVEVDAADLLDVAALLALAPQAAAAAAVVARPA